MPSKWNDVLVDRNKSDSLWRKKFINQLIAYTKRDLIVYYSAWQTKNAPGNSIQISQDDRVSFQLVVEGMRKNNDKLDLIIHTPGGDSQATKMIVEYLRSKYKNIRVFVPITAMSAGTMIALASDEIWLTKAANLGPIDPQFMLPSINGAFIPANEIIKVIDQAKLEISKSLNLQYWAMEINKYPAALVQMAQNAIKQSNIMTKSWLKNWMFRNETPINQESYSEKIQKYFSNYNAHLSHGNHITLDEMKANVPELVVNNLDADTKLRDLIYSVFYAYNIHVMNHPEVVKIIENQYMIGRQQYFFGGK